MERNTSDPSDFLSNVKSFGEINEISDDLLSSYIKFTKLPLIFKSSEQVICEFQISNNDDVKVLDFFSRVKDYIQAKNKDKLIRLPLIYCQKVPRLFLNIINNTKFEYTNEDQLIIDPVIKFEYITMPCIAGIKASIIYGKMKC